MAPSMKLALLDRETSRTRPLPTRAVRFVLLSMVCLAFALAGCSPASSGGDSTSLPAESERFPQANAAESSPSPIPTPLTAAEPTSIPKLVSRPTSPPTPTVMFTPTQDDSACLARGGRIETGQVRNDLLKLPMEYRVYLPPCYDRQSERRYPVLYLIHGQNYNDDQWDRLGVDETLDRLLAAGDLPPFIVVMPRDRSWAQPNEDMFGRVVMEALLPWIDQSYRTLPERRYRAVGGLSRGAGWAIHLGLSEWESFGAIGAHSLPVFWTDLPHLRTWLDEIPHAQLPRIYLDLGDKDREQISKSARWFEELLTEKDIPHEWHLYPGYHEEAYWEEHLEEYLRWYAAGWESQS